MTESVISGVSAARLAGVSLCMIVKNEEHCIGRCLASVAGAVDEIVVVDTGSTDGTVELCRRFTDRIHRFEWIGDFSAARNASLSHATHEWILVLDADETLSMPSPNRLRELIASASETTGGFYFERVNYRDEADEKLCEWNDSVLRLFRNRPGIHFEHAVHERVDHRILSLGLSIADADVTIRHFGFLNGENYAEKSRMYLELLRRQARHTVDDVQTQIMLAAEYEKLGMYDDEEVCLLKAERLSPIKFECLRKLGVFYAAHRKEYRKAFDYLAAAESALGAERASLPTPRAAEFDLFLTTAKCAFMLGAGARAHEYLEKAFALDRDSIELAEFATTLYAKLKMPDRASFFSRRLARRASRPR